MLGMKTESPDSWPDSTAKIFWLIVFGVNEEKFRAAGLANIALFFVLINFQMR